MPRQDNTRQHKTTHDKTRQDKLRQDKTRQDKARQHKTTQDKTRQDQTSPDQTRQDKTRQENIRQDKITEDMTRQVKRRSRLPKDALFLPVFCPKITLVTLSGQWIRQYSIVSEIITTFKRSITDVFNSIANFCGFFFFHTT